MHRPLVESSYVLSIPFQYVKSVGCVDDPELTFCEKIYEKYLTNVS